MLKTRLLTAAVLITVLGLLLYFANSSVFALGMIVLIAVAAWEWANLNPANLAQPNAILTHGFAALCVVLCLATVQFDWWAEVPWSGVVLLWTLLTMYVLTGHTTAWLALPRWLRLCLGAFLLWSTWVALVQLHSQSVNLLLSSMALVWAADSGAYFAGRAYGGRWVARKLAPKISPKKTWEGVVGGLLAMLVLSLVWIYLDRTAGWPRSAMSLVLDKWGAVGLMVFLPLLLFYAIVGDLFESLLKRAVDVKDSGRILPGHGGVLDRVDALLPTLPLMMWVQTLV